MQSAHSAWPPIDTVGGRRSELTVLGISTIRVALLLSLLFHALVLFGWVQRPMDAISDRAGRGKGGGELAVRLAPPPSVAAVPAQPPSAPAPTAEAKRTPAEGRRAPPPPPKAIAQAPSAPPVASAPVEPAPAARVPMQSAGEFFAELEARRRARGAAAESAPASMATADDERARHNRAVAENLGLNRVPTYGREPTGGGIFQLERVGYTDAEFLFFGWNKDIRMRSRQMILVERGANPSIEIAIVRRMIAIIREHESGDFVWRSQRLGRDVTLSARPTDGAGLEEFLMREFFPERRSG